MARMQSVRTNQLVSTPLAAKKLGVSRRYLQRLIHAQRIPTPPITMYGRLRVRLWSREDIQAARQAMQKPWRNS